MVNVCVVQTDNRPNLDYLLLTKEINKKFCDLLGYTYSFIEMDNSKYGNLHPATKKIFVINDFLQNAIGDILIFLDSDAWIQDGIWLNTIVMNLVNSEKQGVFSRDPYLNFNTYINSGGFILKINPLTKLMYSMLIKHLSVDKRHHHAWPFDQYYISDFVFRNRDKFVIFVPDIINTPIGKVIRHNWLKNKKMYDDLAELKDKLSNNSWVNYTPFLENEYYCNQGFPNISEEGYNYFS
jgi:hypothetical protein